MEVLDEREARRVLAEARSEERWIEEELDAVFDVARRRQDRDLMIELLEHAMQDPELELPGSARRRLDLGLSLERLKRERNRGLSSRGFSSASS